MPKVFKLGYVAMGVSDLAQTKDYYLQTMGMQAVASDGGDEFLSVGASHHDIVLRETGEKSLLHLGFQLNKGTDLDDFAKSAQAYGCKAEIKSDSQPGIARLVEVQVTADHTAQFYETVEDANPGFSGRGIAPLRLGHVAVISPEGGKLVKFYQDFLGFWWTDGIGGVANFLTCNHEHHVLNLLEAPVSVLHHVAYQLQDSSRHVHAADTLRTQGIKTNWGPSRHTAGHNIAAYHKDPNNVLNELYTEMDVYIPEANMMDPRPWHETLPMRPQQWGMDQLSAWDVEFAYDLVQAP